MKELMMTVYLASVTSADLIWQRIPNQMILAGYMMGMMIRMMENGVRGLTQGILSGIATIAMLYIFYLIGAIGAGDVKVFSVIGMTCGMTSMWMSAFYSLIFAGAAALIFITKRHEFRVRFEALFLHFISCFRQKRIITYSAFGQGGYLHYAIYISLGYLFTQFYRKGLP